MSPDIWNVQHSARRWGALSSQTPMATFPQLTCAHGETTLQFSEPRIMQEVMNRKNDICKDCLMELMFHAWIKSSLKIGMDHKSSSWLDASNLMDLWQDAVDLKLQKARHKYKVRPVVLKCKLMQDYRLQLRQYLLKHHSSHGYAAAWNSQVILPLVYDPIRSEYGEPEVSIKSHAMSATLSNIVVRTIANKPVCNGLQAR